MPVDGRGARASLCPPSRGYATGAEYMLECCTVMGAAGKGEPW